jgi:hypothetical protein
MGEKFFLHLDLGMSSSFARNWTVLDGAKSPEVKSNGTSFFLTPAASYFITSRVAVQASLGGISYGTTKPKTSDIENWNFGSSFAFNSLVIGASVYF